MSETRRSARNMTPAQARREFTKATAGFPPAEAKKIVRSAVSVARQAQAKKLAQTRGRAERREAEQKRYWESVSRGAGLQR